MGNKYRLAWSNHLSWNKNLQWRVNQKKTRTAPLLLKAAMSSSHHGGWTRDDAMDDNCRRHKSLLPCPNLWWERMWEWQCVQRWAVHAVRVREEVKERVEIREVYDSTKEREGLREVRLERLGLEFCYF